MKEGKKGKRRLPKEVKEVIKINEIWKKIIDKKIENLKQSARKKLERVECPLCGEKKLDVLDDENSSIYSFRLVCRGCNHEWIFCRECNTNKECFENCSCLRNENYKILSQGRES